MNIKGINSTQKIINGTANFNKILLFSSPQRMLTSDDKYLKIILRFSNFNSLWNEF